MKYPYPMPITRSMIEDVFKECNTRSAPFEIYTNDPNLREEINQACKEYINKKYPQT